MPPYHWWRTVFFLIPAIAVYTIVLGTISLASSFVDRSGRFGHKCARTWSWLILKTTGVTLEVAGLERVPRGTSYVFASNHQSIYDIPVLFWTLDFELRILAKASLGSFPFLGWHLARTGHVLVDRKKPGADVFRQVRALMKSGHSLFVFPEGTRSLDGSLGRFRAGTFMMAIEAGLPVVPVAIDGSRFVMRKGRLMTCPGHVRVTVLDPIPTEGRKPDQARAFARIVQEAVQSALPPGDPAPPAAVGESGEATA
jgi:1-acyl-sn-glycerol-3-phosphate acyltransferase